MFSAAEKTIRKNTRVLSAVFSLCVAVALLLFGAVPQAQAAPTPCEHGFSDCSANQDNGRCDHLVLPYTQSASNDRFADSSDRNLDQRGDGWAWGNRDNDRDTDGHNSDPVDHGRDKDKDKDKDKERCCHNNNGKNHHHNHNNGKCHCCNNRCNDHDCFDPRDPGGTADPNDSEPGDGTDPNNDDDTNPSDEGNPGGNTDPGDEGNPGDEGDPGDTTDPPGNDDDTNPPDDEGDPGDNTDPNDGDDGTNPPSDENPSPPSDEDPQQNDTTDTGPVAPGDTAEQPSDTSNSGAASYTPSEDASDAEQAQTQEEDDTVIIAGAEVPLVGFDSLQAPATLLNAQVVALLAAVAFLATYAATLAHQLVKRRLPKPDEPYLLD